MFEWIQGTQHTNCLDGLLPDARIRLHSQKPKQHPHQLGVICIRFDNLSCVTRNLSQSLEGSISLGGGRLVVEHFDDEVENGSDGGDEFFSCNSGKLANTFETFSLDTDRRVEAGSGAQKDRQDGWGVRLDETCGSADHKAEQLGTLFLLSPVNVSA